MILLIGLDFNTSPLTIREKLSFSSHEIPSLLKEISSFPKINEVAILSTCNRTEIYMTGESFEEIAGHIVKLLQDIVKSKTAEDTEDTAEDFYNYLYMYSNEQAARHAFEVASGLQSMVVGEPQILAQVKEAFSIASKAKTLGDELRALFNIAIKVGKRSRSQTNITGTNTSISGAAVKLAADALGSLQGKGVLLIGAGRMSQLSATLLSEHGVKNIYLSNRTLESIERNFGGMVTKTVNLYDIPQILRSVDLVISATSAPQLILTESAVVSSLRDTGKNLVIIDIAVPRDVEEAVGDLPGISLFTIDSLKDYGFVDGHKEDIERIQVMIDLASNEFENWQQVQSVVPAIAALRKHVDASHEEEFIRVLGRLRHLSEDDQEVVRLYGQRLVDKMFHHLVSRIRAFSTNPETQKFIPLMQELFDEPTRTRDKIPVAKDHVN